MRPSPFTYHAIQETHHVQTNPSEQRPIPPGSPHGPHRANQSGYSSGPAGRSLGRIARGATSGSIASPTILTLKPRGGSSLSLSDSPSLTASTRRRCIEHTAASRSFYPGRRRPWLGSLRRPEQAPPDTLGQGPPVRRQVPHPRAPTVLTEFSYLAHDKGGKSCPRTQRC